MSFTRHATVRGEAERPSELIDAAKVVGNEELEAKCSEARKLLIRDVVFAASLFCSLALYT